MRIGVLCASEIARRRFLPALVEIDEAAFIGVGINTAEERFGTGNVTPAVVEATIERSRRRAMELVNEYGGSLFPSYWDLIRSPEIDGIYISLPPSLHFKWAKRALLNGKHVLLEKPFTTALHDTEALLSIAKANKLAVNENYMFMFHDQISAIDSIVESGELGLVRLYRMDFGFPMRSSNDFRYIRELGGGALLDAGGYTIRYASHMLGDSARVVYATKVFSKQCDVDIAGTAALINDSAVTAQVAFGMDNEYRCDLEVWGNSGILRSGRVFTAPKDFVPKVEIVQDGKTSLLELPVDDSFRKSILHFLGCMNNSTMRITAYETIAKQARLMKSFARLSGEAELVVGKSCDSDA